MSIATQRCSSSSSCDYDIDDDNYDDNDDDTDYNDDDTDDIDDDYTDADDIGDTDDNGSDNDLEDLDALFAQIFKDLEFLNQCEQYDCATCGGDRQQNRTLLPEGETSAKKSKQNKEEHLKESVVSFTATSIEPNAQNASKNSVDDKGQGLKYPLARTEHLVTPQKTNHASDRITNGDSKIWPQILGERHSKIVRLHSSRRNDHSLHGRQRSSRRGRHKENVQKIQEPAVVLGRQFGQIASNPEALNSSKRSAVNVSSARSALAPVDQNAIIQSANSSTVHMAQSAPVKANQNAAIILAQSVRAALAQNSQSTSAQNATKTIGLNATATLTQNVTPSLPQNIVATFCQTVPATLAQYVSAPIHLASFAHKPDSAQVSGQWNSSPIHPIYVSSVISSDSHRDSHFHLIHGSTENYQAVQSLLTASSPHTAILKGGTSIPHAVISQQLLQAAQGQPSTSAGPSYFHSNQNGIIFNPTPALVVSDTPTNISTRLSGFVQGISHVQQSAQTTGHYMTSPWASHQ